jgi:DNA polymerase III subunit delta'
LQKLASAVDFEWLIRAADRLAEVERGMRRNLLRSLSLDALAVAMEQNQLLSG